ncbi:MAG TPA: cell division protein FtsH, partial [Syntrophales bacterium]|nr:cell division protein FtsH [Syntrophales bacterium]
SEETAQRIDEEITRLVSESYEKAKQLLSDHIDILNRIALELLEKEVLNTAELDEIIQMKRDDADGSGNAVSTQH